MTDQRKKLEELYRATDYECMQAGVVLKVGQPSQTIARLMMLSEEKGYAFITAWNPGSEPVSSAQNRKQNSMLEERLTEERYLYFQGRGVPHAEGWDPEESFLILGISKKEAIALGKEFGQTAILFGRGGGEPDLLFMDDFQDLT